MMRHESSNVQIPINGKPFQGIESFSYTPDRTPARGLGTARASVEGTFEMASGDFDALIEGLLGHRRTRYWMRRAELWRARVNRKLRRLAGWRARISQVARSSGAREG